jgi:hypothetical protein
MAASPTDIDLLIDHADYPASTSKASLASAAVVRAALASLSLLSPELDASFAQLFSLEQRPPPPPPPPPIPCLFQDGERLDKLPPHGLTPEQLKTSRFALTALAPQTCKRLAPQYKAFKEFLHDEVRLDRAPGIEQSGNQK